MEDNTDEINWKKVDTKGWEEVFTQKVNKQIDRISNSRKRLMEKAAKDLNDRKMRKLQRQKEDEWEKESEVPKGVETGNELDDFFYAALEEAAQSGNMDKYRRLREQYTRKREALMGKEKGPLTPSPPPIQYKRVKTKQPKPKPIIQPKPKIKDETPVKKTGRKLNLID